MEEKVIKMKPIGEMYFCSAELRPENCLKYNTSICCIHCDMTVRCLEVNKNSKVKPCNLSVVGMDEWCEFSI